MLRVLQMIGSLNVGGSQTMMLNIYRNIDREKLQFDFVLDHPQERYFAPELERMGARIYEMPSFHGFNVAEIRRAWDKLLTEHTEYKVLHSHIRSYASLYLPISSAHGLKTIIHSHSTSNGRGISSAVKQLMQKPLRNQADILMACSRESGEWLFGKAACERENFIVMPNAVDVSRYRLTETVREKLRRELGVTNKLVVGHVGRFHPTKNHSFMLDAFKLLHDRNNASTLIFVGDGELRADTERKVTELGLSDSVIFTGNRDDVPELLSAMDIFIFPSIWEGLPVTLIEAQAAGLPCLVSQNVTCSVDISPLVKYLPINDARLWTDEMMNVGARTDVTAYIKTAGFDVTDSAKKITELYMNLAEMN